MHISFSRIPQGPFLGNFTAIFFKSIESHPRTFTKCSCQLLGMPSKSFDNEEAVTLSRPKLDGSGGSVSF